MTNTHAQLKILEAQLWDAFNDVSRQAREAIIRNDVDAARDLISKADGIEMARKMVMGLMS